MKAVDDRELNSYELYWRKDGACNLSGVTKDDKQKPAVYKLYDFTKGGNRHNRPKNGSIYYEVEIMKVDKSCLFVPSGRNSSKRIDNICLGK